MLKGCSGKEYYETLVSLYGEKKAKRRVKDYLSLQIFNDEEEYRFCSELRKVLNSVR